MQRLTVNHKTTYSYRRPVKFGEHRVMFRPRDSHDLRLIEATLTTSPTAQIRWLHDVFGNSVAIASFAEPSDRLVFDSTIIVDRYPVDDFDFPIEEYARTVPFSYPASEVPDLGRSIERHYPDPERTINRWARQFLNPAGASETENVLIAMTRGVHAEFQYEERHDPGVQSPVETLRRQAGACRDFAVFMMEAARSVGLAARFVSGYLYDPAIDGNESGIQGAGATHAWVQVYLPGAGWLEFDPTNGRHGGANLVPVAVTREPAQAVPVSGSFEGDEEDALGMEVVVTVRTRQTPEEGARQVKAV